MAADKEKTLVIAVLAVLIIIVSLSLGYVIVNGDVGKLIDNNDNNNTNDNNDIKTQTQMIYVSPDEANELIETDPNLKILDVRSCKCKFNGERLTDTTEWTEYLQFEKFYNTTFDLLVYCNDGNNSYSNESNYFCSNLIGKAQGMIYTLDGGIANWKKEGYTTYIPPE